MPVGEFFNNLKESLTQSHTAISLSSNSIFISVLIVSIILLLVALIVDEENFMYSLFKVGVYSIISTIVIMLMHDNALRLKNSSISQDIKLVDSSVSEDTIVGQVAPLPNSNPHGGIQYSQTTPPPPPRDSNYDVNEKYYGAKVDEAENLLKSLNSGLGDSEKTGGWRLPA